MKERQAVRAVVVRPTWTLVVSVGVDVCASLAFDEHLFVSYALLGLAHLALYLNRTSGKTRVAAASRSLLGVWLRRHAMCVMRTGEPY